MNPLVLLDQLMMIVVVTNGREEETSTDEDTAMTRTNQTVNCSVQWMMEPWYINQIKQKT